MREEAYCLAENVYHEARNQPQAGQMAVMSVTINRVNDSRYPNTICGVTKQGPSRPSWKDETVMIPIKHRCQFSWYCDGKSDRIYDLETFDNILMLAEAIVLGQIQVLDITEGATHYHADYVEPSWAKTKTKTIEIEDHIFYRWEIQE
jgi:spore germination cell wall hydrolase CwlJ-like protein